MAKTYRFGIVGCGVIAKVHANAILQLDNAVIGGVYDPCTQNAVNFAKKYDCMAYNSLEDILNAQNIHIINICTPSCTHAEITVAAANKGKHVMVEKPLAINEKDLTSVLIAAKETHVKICVVSQLRFSQGVQHVRNAVQNGLFGQIILASLSMRYHRSEEYYQNGGWRGKWATDGGGALMNQGIHGLDLLCFICGRVVKVSAQYKTLSHNIEVEDTLCAVLEFENGTIGTVEATTAVKYGLPRRIEISGTNGSATLVEDNITQWLCDTDMLAQTKKWEMDAANDPAALDTIGHLLQMQNLIKAIEETEDLLVDAQEGSNAVKVILAIYKSAQEGKQIVML